MSNWKTEGTLARQLGVTRIRLRTLRTSLPLLLRDDYIEKPMRYSDAGEKKLCAAFNLPWPTPIQEVSLPLEKEQPLIELVARRIPANTAIVLCDPIEPDFGQDRRLVRVKVRSSKNFIPGMRLPVRHLQDDLYELARPCPRWKGIW